MKTFDIWTLVDYLPTRMPLERDTIQTILGAVLRETDSNEFTAFFEGGPVLLKNDVEIESIDLRVNRGRASRRLLVLKFAGKCVTKAEVFGRNQGLELTDHPRGRSLDEETSWSVKQSWGQLSFGFSERNPDCLRTVVFKTD